MLTPPTIALELRRFTRVGSSLFGAFVSYEGMPCNIFTVENFDLAIPAGVYRIGFECSPRFGENCLTVFDVPGREGIRVHVANRASELEGCIAPGLYFGTLQDVPAVLSSRVALGRLRDAVREMPASHRYLRVLGLSLAS